jgi:hypothetical protein
MLKTIMSGDFSFYHLFGSARERQCVLVERRVISSSCLHIDVVITNINEELPYQPPVCKKKKKMRGGKVISATLILVFSFLYTPFSSLPVQSFHFHLLYLQSDSLPPNSVDKVGPAYSGSSVPSLCLVPPWVYALLDCAMCARVDTWNCKRTWREREKSATIRKRHEMKLSSHKPISSYILRQLDSFFWLRYISFWFLKVV